MLFSKRSSNSTNGRAIYAYVWCLQKPNESTVRLINLWNDFATENEFDAIVSEIKSNTSVDVSNKAASTSSALDRDAPEYRTCPVLLDKILRKDLKESVKEVVRRKLIYAMINSSDFQAQFLSIIQMLTILLKIPSSR